MVWNCKDKYIPQANFKAGSLDSLFYSAKIFCVVQNMQHTLRLEEDSAPPYHFLVLVPLSTVEEDEKSTEPLIMGKGGNKLRPL